MNLLARSAAKQRFAVSVLNWLIPLCALSVVIPGSAGAPPQMITVKSLPQIIADNHLRVVALNDSVRVRAHRNTVVGYEADLLKAFAKSLGVGVKVEIVDHPTKLQKRLQNRDFHIVIGARFSNLQRDRLSLQETATIDTTRVVAVHHRRARPVNAPTDLTNKRVAVASAGPAVQVMQQINAEHPLLRWRAQSKTTDLELLSKVATGQLDVTFLDERISNAALGLFPQLRKSWTHTNTQPVAWHVPLEGDADLEASINHFINDAANSRLLDRLAHRHFSTSDALNYYDTMQFHKRLSDTLPEYRHLFVEAGHRAGLDWRLIAALSYQESLWNPKAKSFTGVRGIMQLTSVTAESLQADPTDTYESVMAGARYLRQQMDRLPESIKSPDRAWFALAAYNIGYGHILDARWLAEHYEYNPNHWVDVREFVARLEEPEYYEQTRYGKARGNEAKRHVYRIRRLYEIISAHEAGITIDIPGRPVVSTEGVTPNTPLDRDSETANLVLASRQR